MSTINEVHSSRYTPMNYTPGETLSLGKEIQNRIFKRIDQWDAKLDSILPNFFFQNKLDTIGHLIEKTFKPLEKFNSWLDSNGLGKWYTQVATCLVKLPMRSVRNIIQLLYSIIKGLISSAVHPAKALNDIARLITQLVFDLTRPEVWSKLGAGIIGASCGQAAATLQPVSLLGAGIGAACMFAGITLGPLKAALEAEKDKRTDAVMQHLLYQAKQIPEAMLTGLCMGLIVGGIQRVQMQRQVALVKAKTKVDVQQFIKENELPSTTKWSFNPKSGKIEIQIPLKYNTYGMRHMWQDGLDPSKVIEMPTYKDFRGYFEVKIQILPDSGRATIHGLYGHGRMSLSRLEHKIPLDVFKNVPKAHPAAAPADLRLFGAALGTIAYAHH